MTSGGARLLAGRRVVAFGTYRTDLHPRVAVLVEGLRAHGATVVEVDVPLPLDTAAKVRLLRRPWTLPLLVAQVLRCWARLVGGARLARRGGPVDAVLVGYMGHFDVHLARLLFGRVPVVLDQLVFARDTAVDRGTTSRALLAALGALDAAAVAQADVVVVDTDENAALAGRRAAARVVVAGVGATAEWFAAADRTTHAGPLRAAFVGLFTPLQGAVVVARAAALLRPDDGVEVVLVGRGQDLAEARRAAAGAPAVRWVDWVPHDELPAFVAGHDVALGIFGSTPKALRVVPTKVFQGAAAGCVVVTSATAPQRRVLDGAAVLVAPDDPVALADALRDLAADPARRAGLADASRALAEQRFSPEAVTTALARRVAAASPGPRRRRAPRAR